MYLENPPFELGETLDGTASDGTTLINGHLLGTIFEFPAKTVGAADNRGNKSRYSGKTIKAICLRNTSGIRLYGKRIGVINQAAAAGYDGMHVCDGYAAGGVGNRSQIVVIDEYLASTGVADDDLFWGIIAGPVKVLVPAVGADFNGDIAVGNLLVNSTGTTSQSLTQSGRVSNVTLTAATAGNTLNGYNGFQMAANAVGWALSARTTQESTAGTDVLINACIRLF